MPRIMIDEFHLAIFVPKSLPDREANAIQATLDSRGFQTALRRGMQAILRRYPALAKVTFTQTR